MSAGFGNETAATAGARRLAAQPVTVTTHAVIRARARRHYDGLPSDQVRARIEAEVQLAFAAGRVAGHRPVWATQWSARELAGAKPKAQRCLAGQRFVWDEAAQHGWIVRQDDVDGLVVITSLHRVRAEAAA